MPKATSSRKGKGRKAKEVTTDVAADQGEEGEVQVSDDELPTGNPQLSAAGVDAHLDNKTALKILQGRYVHLSSLLPSSRQTQKLIISQPAGQLTSVSSNRRLYNFSEWLDAFIIYASVRAAGHPLEAAPLFKYLQTIKRINARGGNFVLYDENFRGKHRGQATIPWHQLDTEEFSWASTDPSYTPFEEFQKKRQVRFRKFSSPSSPAASTRTRSGPCFAFNSPEGCDSDRCKYKHVCRRCTGPHTLAACGLSNEKRFQPRFEKRN